MDTFPFLYRYCFYFSSVGLLVYLYDYLMIFCIVWIVAVHIFGRIYRSHHKKFTVNSISRTIIYEEIPVQCGFCLCTYSTKHEIHFDDVIEIKHQIIQRDGQQKQFAVFELRNGGQFTPDVHLTDFQFQYIKQLINLNNQQDDQAIQRQGQRQPNLRYAPPQIIFQQAPQENREQETSNQMPLNQIQQQDQIQSEIAQQSSHSSEKQSQQQQSDSIDHSVPVSLPSAQQSQNSSEQSQQEQDKHQIESNQIHKEIQIEEVENKEIEDKKEEKVKKQKKMNKETKNDQKHPESKISKHKSKSHKNKKEKGKQYEKMNDTYNTDNEQEKQSADKADDIQDDDKQQQTHTGLEINPTEDAEDV